MSQRHCKRQKAFHLQVFGHAEVPGAGTKRHCGPGGGVPKPDLVSTLVLDGEACWGGSAQLSLSSREKGMFGNLVEQEIHTSTL